MSQGCAVAPDSRSLLPTKATNLKSPDPSNLPGSVRLTFAAAQRNSAAAQKMDRSRMAQDDSIDDIDRAIVAELRKNGRATNQQIADRLSLTAATVSSRIRKMEDDNKLRVVAVSDFAAHGLNVLMEIAVEVDGRPASQVVDELSAFPEVFAAHVVAGSYDIDLLVALHEFEELPDLLLNKFSQVRGIRSMTPTIAVDVIKYQFDVAPIEARERA